MNHLTEAIKEARALNPTDIYELETLQVTHKDVTFSSSTLQVCLILDGLLPRINLPRLDAHESYTDIQWSLITFDNDGVDNRATTFQDTPLLLERIGTSTTGSDALFPTSIAAIKHAADTLNWTEGNDHARVIIYLSNRPLPDLPDVSTTLAPLKSKNIIFASNNGIYPSLITGTSGQSLNTSSLQTSIESFFTRVYKEGALDSIYLINDNKPHTLPDENGISRDFVTRGFSLKLSGDTKNGVQNLNITVSDTDRKVTAYLNEAKKYREPVELTFRIYLSSDLSRPANNPPLVLYVASSQRTSKETRITASTIDLVNAPFPNSYYTTEKFPL